MTKHELIAYHMAGHCVAAIHYKRSLESVSILPSEDGSAGCLVCRWPNTTTDFQGFLDFLEQEWVIAKAGGIAEYIANGKTWTGTSELVKGDVDYVYETGTPLHKKGLIAFDPMMDRCSNTALKLIKRPKNWARVEALARGFTTYKVLSVDQILEIHHGAGS